MEKIKKTLVLENKMFEIIHVISIVCILLLTILIAIENYFNNKIKTDNRYSLLEDIEIVENEKTDTTTVKTYNNEEVLLNPGKGIVLFSSRNNEKYNYLISTGYNRYNWCEIEPEEGVYNWNIIDDTIESFAKEGKKFAFGIKCASTASNIQYVTPKWVFDAGANFREADVSFWLSGVITHQTIPVWTDEIFLEKLNHFVKALGERYDGNENIAFIDIRSYGNYGEQHVGNLGGEEITPEQLKELYIKPYMEAFHNTLLVNPWGREEYNEVYKWCIENGISIRSDGILYGSDKFSNVNGNNCLLAYSYLPTIFEFGASYKQIVSEGQFSEDRLLKIINNGKPSYLHFDKNMYEENKEFCEMLANKIGYYFKFKGAKYTSLTSTKEENDITLNFKNEGVAPLYEPCTVYIGLLDENYNLVKKYKTDINPHTWMPDEEVQENIKLKLDGVETGKYIISLGLFYNEEDDKPTYLLGNSGGTDDKWYVFGEIYISNPAEEYSIEIENKENLINSYKGYNINITANNLRENSNYAVKIYINNQLKGTMSIDNSQSVYNKNITLKFEDGKNVYKIQIEKDNEIVYQVSKEIYVSNFVNDYSSISNTATSKYSEFKEKFAGEIAQISGLSSKIEQMENYMENVGKVETKIVESASINAMKKHYEIGDLILQAYKEGTLKVEDVKVSSMLDMLDDIGKSYEDLVTVSAQTVTEIETTNTAIQEVENLINNNQEVEIIYPSKILEFSKDYYEKASYINSLEEENPIKAGLIISKNLHSKLLASWANTFANIQIDRYIKDYIDNNPVTIEYSETNITNKNVKATLVTNADIQITNNSNSKEYTFEKNGNFAFEYTIKGQKCFAYAIVNNIDKTPPTITGVTEGKTYVDRVTPIISDKNLQSVKLILNGETVKNYQANTELTEEGIYELTATDKAKNTAKVSFQLIVNKEDSYKIEEDKIKNITSNTAKSEFDKKIGLVTTYTITRNGEEIVQDDIIATGDVLKTKTGQAYTLIVTGDINKDGKVNLKDLVKMRKFLLEGNNLDEIELLAADCNLDGSTIGLKDFVRMRIMILTKDIAG